MQYQKQSLIQRQELRLTPQMLQSIQVLALPLQDLRLRIQEELDANPALELVDDRTGGSLDEVRDTVSEDDYSESSYAQFQGDENAKRMFMEGTLAHERSLVEHLLWQLRLQPIDEAEYRLGEMLIQNLDDNGFHREDPATLIAPECAPALERLMTMIRGFEPVGTCVADYHESLIVQAELTLDDSVQAVAILRDHLEALERGKYAEIAATLAVTEDDVLTALAAIKRLTPFPGLLFSNDQTRYVVPDLVVRRREGQFFLALNDDEIPVLGLSEGFRDPESLGDTEARRFAEERGKQAKSFMTALEQRNATLLRVAKAVLDFQRDFFLRGRKYLVPLTLRDIAEELELSEATISRSTSGKYIQTEWGIFELKHFFSNRVAGSAGSRHSKVSVKETVRELLEQPQHKSLSDQALSKLLAERGINIARRTVTKYRKELRIQSSYDRS